MSIAFNRLTNRAESVIMLFVQKKMQNNGRAGFGCVRFLTFSGDKER